jgi:hypothetical protein
LLTRVPAGGEYATDLPPALLLAGVGGGLSAPAAQIGVLSGVMHSMTGLASGLVETMREIGGAVGVAALSTVLVSRAGDIAGAANTADRGLAAANAFHDAFWLIFVVAVLGGLTAAIAFPRRTTQKIELVEPAPSHGSVVQNRREGLPEMRLGRVPATDGERCSFVSARVRPPRSGPDRSPKRARQTAIAGAVGQAGRATWAVVTVTMNFSASLSPDPSGCCSSARSSPPDLAVCPGRTAVLARVLILVAETLPILASRGGAVVSAAVLGIADGPAVVGPSRPGIVGVGR